MDKMPESMAFILRIEDPLLGRQIESFLSKLKGCRIVYITHSKNNRLYVIDSERLKQATFNEEEG